MAKAVNTISSESPADLLGKDRCPIRDRILLEGQRLLPLSCRKAAEDLVVRLNPGVRADPSLWRTKEKSGSTGLFLASGPLQAMAIIGVDQRYPIRILDSVVPYPFFSA